MIDVIILLFIITVLALLAVTSTEEDIQKDNEWTGGNGI